MGRRHEPRRAGNDEVVLVTGASSGIGADAAAHLNELGYVVIGTVRKEADAEQLVASAAHPDHMHAVLLDVTRDDQLAPAREQVEALLPTGRGLTALFSNAGVASLSGELSCETCPLERQQRVMDVNFWGAVRVVQTFLPLVRRERGTIVLNSALMAHTVLPFNAGYAASKCALEGWADALRREVRPHGVRVAMVEAAAIATSLEAKQAPEPVPSDSPYPEQQAVAARFLAMGREHADDPACSPRRFSEKVVEAIQSPRPKPRAIVGGGSRPIWAIGLLPDRVQDLVLTTMVKRMAASAR